MRRFVDLTRVEILQLLATVTSTATVACAAAIRRGAAFRVHQDTVTREGALRIYTLRAQAMQLDRIPSLGMDEALKELAASPYPRLRIAAVSSVHDFTIFMDPECQTLVACLGIEGRTAF